MGFRAGRQAFSGGAMQGINTVKGAIDALRLGIGPTFAEITGRAAMLGCFRARVCAGKTVLSQSAGCYNGLLRSESPATATPASASYVFRP